MKAAKRSRRRKFVECHNYNLKGGPVTALYDYVCRCYDTNR